MRFNYDPNVDAMYIKLSDRQVIESEEIRKDIILDYDEAGNVTGVELLNVSKNDNAPPTPAAP